MFTVAWLFLKSFIVSHFSSGYFAGAYNPDPKLKKNGFPADGDRTGKVVVIKTHHYGHECAIKYDRAILLMRNPTGPILSEFNRQASYGDHVGLAHPALFYHKGKYWRYLLIKLYPILGFLL